MNWKPKFVSGIYVGVETPKCWGCMTEEEYLSGGPIFFNEECDYQIHCEVCGDAISHNLTKDGIAYEAELATNQPKGA